MYHLCKPWEEVYAIGYHKISKELERRICRCWFSPPPPSLAEQQRAKGKPSQRKRRTRSQGRTKSKLEPNERNKTTRLHRRTVEIVGTTSWKRNGKKLTPVNGVERGTWTLKSDKPLQKVTPKRWEVGGKWQLWREKREFWWIYFCSLGYIYVKKWWSM